MKDTLTLVVDVMWYLRSANELRACEITGVPGIDLACLATVDNKEAHGISIHEYTLVLNALQSPYISSRTTNIVSIIPIPTGVNCPSYPA